MSKLLILHCFWTFLKELHPNIANFTKIRWSCNTNLCRRLKNEALELWNSVKPCKCRVLAPSYDNFWRFCVFINFHRMKKFRKSPCEFLNPLTQSTTAAVILKKVSIYLGRTILSCWNLKTDKIFSTLEMSIHEKKTRVPYGHIWSTPPNLGHRKIRNGKKQKKAVLLI